MPLQRSVGVMELTPRTSVGGVESHNLPLLNLFSRLSTQINDIKIKSLFFSPL